MIERRLLRRQGLVDDRHALVQRPGPEPANRPAPCGTRPVSQTTSGTPQACESANCRPHDDGEAWSGGCAGQLSHRRRITGPGTRSQQAGQAQCQASGEKMASRGDCRTGFVRACGAKVVKPMGLSSKRVGGRRRAWGRRVRLVRAIELVEVLQDEAHGPGRAREGGRAGKRRVPFWRPSSDRRAMKATVVSGSRR